MYKLLVILYMIKLYARINIYKHIKGKYGQRILKDARLLETIRSKLTKVKYDIEFLNTCKRNRLCPTFARPKFAIKISINIKKKITMTIISEEIKYKHKKKRLLEKQIKEVKARLDKNLGFITICTLNKNINKSIKKKSKIWKANHERKLERLFSSKANIN